MNYFKTLQKVNIRFSLSEGDVANIPSIRKRDGRVVSFSLDKISQAVLKALKVTKEGDESDADFIAKKVARDVLKLRRASHSERFVPDVEMIQDLVEEELMLQDFVKTAKAYILYREKHAELREIKGVVPARVKDLVARSRKYFRNPLAEFIYFRTYARWIDEEGRRETWIETVDRYLDFMKENIGDRLSEEEYSEVRQAILNHEAMPSMRLMQFAGKAARNTNVCTYNCSYIAPSNWQDFAEVMYVSMCGTGVGFSVESQNIQALPQIKKQTGEQLPKQVVDDSKEGWADALALGLNTWADGKDIKFDLSGLRPAGARLKTMGGKSSGPEPLRQLLEFTRSKMLNKQGKRLSNIDAHDILCKIGDCVVSGGVRRSALISLSDLDDTDMRDAKKGQFYVQEPQRSLANNSAVYHEKPLTTDFIDEWVALMKSGSGERGIFNRGNLSQTLPRRRLERLVKGEEPQWGTNPCGEIILKSKQFCNLTEVVARPKDTLENLKHKIKIASILGTYQATLTNFPYLSKEWQENCETERLLGVSITGQWDCETVRDKKVLQQLREEAVATNKEYAERFGIPQATCVTCVKPSGTVSQVVDCASGMHPRHARYYIRRVRISATDALFMMLKDQGVPYYPEVGQSVEDASTYVFEFPVKAPEGAVVKDDLTALEQLLHWKMVKENFTEHNPSVTISVGDDEWIRVADWLYDNWELVGGLSFLPRTDHVYQLAPYEEIDKERYEELLKGMQDIDYAKIVTYEKMDDTDVKMELACAAGVCDIG
ncbi:MAG: ATP cone domain-containing protein [bacterium]